MGLNKSTKILISISALMSALAGIIHLWIAPIHWFHSPGHGAFFLTVGVAQVLWANLVWRQPASRLYYIGAIMSGWLIALYVITRWLPSPFGHGPEAVDMIGLACKLFESLAMATLAILIFQGLAHKDGRGAAWHTLVLILLFSIVAGFSTYTVGRALEPLLPGLSAPETEHPD